MSGPAQRRGVHGRHLWAAPKRPAAAQTLAPGRGPGAPVHGEKRGENRGEKWDNTMENHGKTMENHGKPWKNHGNVHMESIFS